MAYKTYKVVEGDTLTKIAKKHGTTPQALVRLNDIPGPKMIKPGMEIIVPDNSEHEAVVQAAEEAQAKSVAAAKKKAVAEARAVAAAAENAAAPAFKTIKYTAVEGDTFSKIAKRYGTTPQALVRLNGITGPKQLKPGMEIVIPDNSVHEAAVAAEDKTKALAEQEKAIAKARAAAAAQAVAEARAATPEFKTLTHKVAAGETLTKIAKKYGTTPQALVRLNGIAGPKMVKPGMEIVVPDNSEHEAAVKAAKEAQAKSIKEAREKADEQARMIVVTRAAAEKAKKKG